MISNYKNNALGYFRFYYSVLKTKLLFSILLSILVSALDSIGLAMLIPLLQSVSGPGESNQDSLGYLHYITDFIQAMGFSLTLETILITLLFIFCLKGLIKYLELRYQAVVGPYFMKKVRHELVKGLQKISYKGFIQIDAGNLQNSFIAEVQRLTQALKNYFAYIQALVMLLTYVAFALLVNFQFAILLSVSAGLTNLLYSRIYKKMKAASVEISKKGDNINDYLIQAVQYFKYLKSTNYLSRYSQKLIEVIDKTEYLNRKTGNYSAITIGAREPMIFVIVVLVIYVQVILMGGALGSIILSLILFYRALNYLIIAQQNWQSFLQFTGSLQNVSRMSETMKTLKEEHGGIAFETLNDDIVISNVDMAYGAKVILSEASITIPRKQTIAFVGESGSGKTTLANLIMGLVTPDKGSVMIGDIPLNEFDLGTYRSRIGYISQDSVIFNDNIYNNITFWADRSPENLMRFWEVIKLTNLKDFVENLVEKEMTKLGNNGILISGGQKQRISIAREMFKNVEILILDEATSALDSETELIIQENIEKLHGHYTMIVIAHRLSTIKHVDQIYLLDKGKVLVSGNFENMIKTSEKFQRMVKL